MGRPYPGDGPGTLATVEADFDAIASAPPAEPGVGEGPLAFVRP